jgi:hemerythrin
MGVDMPLIEWDESLSIGFDEIDDQHKRWIQIANKLHDVLCCGEQDELLRINDTSLAAMIEYARTHFASEEQFMEKINYPGLGAHRRVHAGMVERLRRIEDEVDNGLRPLNTQLMSLLKNWLKEHILKEDKRIGQYAAKNGIAV